VSDAARRFTAGLAPGLAGTYQARWLKDVPELQLYPNCDHHLCRRWWGLAGSDRDEPELRWSVARSSVLILAALPASPQVGAFAQTPSNGVRILSSAGVSYVECGTKLTGIRTTGSSIGNGISNCADGDLERIERGKYL
jgi:hypothetical protein